MTTRRNPPSNTPPADAPAGQGSQPDRPTLHNGRYRLRQKLGQGGMGAVYLADDMLLPGRQVAVKENLNASSAAQSQFKREALLLARLRHPNLPQVTDFFVTAEGKQYLVMDYVPGENLQQILRRHNGPLPVAEALGILEQIMQALGYMHAWRDPESGRVRPIIHRDIKPANIKRTPEGHVVLVDFGIAKFDGGTLSNTAASAKALTPGYAPLEQYSGGTDMRSDIYSLGATLYALLSGKAPPTATDMALAGPKQGAPLLGSLKGAPSTVTKVIVRAMQSKPADRYQSVAEMHQALFGRPLASGGAVGSRAAPADGRPVARRGWAAFVIGGVLLLLAGGIGWLLLAGRGVGQETTAAAGAPISLAGDSAAPPLQPPAAATMRADPAAPAVADVAPATATATAEPTITIAPEPTSTPSATPVAAVVSTPETGALLTTPTPAPRAIKPTSTALATATPAPSATSTATMLPTITPAPPAAAPAPSEKGQAAVAIEEALSASGGPTSVTIQWPPGGTNTDSATEFRWQPNGPLAEGQVYEVVFWQQGEGPDAGRAWTAATPDTQMMINPGDRAGSYIWGVWLGRIDATGKYERVRYLGGGNTFDVARSGGADGPGGGGDSPLNTNSK